MGTKRKLPAENVIRTLGDNVLTMLAINIFKMFLENVMPSFKRTFWEQKENYPLKTLSEHCMAMFSHF